MHDFQYRDSELYCEDVPIREIAKEVGTPFYLYSYHTLKSHFETFNAAFSKIPHLICFAVKANSNLAILKALSNLGAGMDVVSGGELFRALRVGVPPQRIVYSGVGKNEEEIEFALKNEILMLNVESSQELILISEIAERLGRKARVGIRVNPDIDPKTHPYIATGLKENKFGIDIRGSLKEYKFAQGLKNIHIIGVDCHLGSQILILEPFLEAVKRLKELLRKLGKEGIEIKYFDLGGGLGITYKNESPPHPHQYAQALISEIEDLNCSLILEPGRVIVGNAGILVTKVLYTKKRERKNFIIVDAGMNDLLRPSLYNAYQAIKPVKKAERKEILVDVVGPLCESGDLLARGRLTPEFKPGELMAVMSAGAYGFTMSSNYNSRPRIAEILVKGDKFYIVRKRESWEDLIRGEEIPPFLANGWGADR